MAWVASFGRCRFLRQIQQKIKTIIFFSFQILQDTTKTYFSQSRSVIFILFCVIDLSTIHHDKSIDCKYFAHAGSGVHAPGHVNFSAQLVYSFVFPTRKTNPGHMQRMIIRTLSEDQGTSVLTWSWMWQTQLGEMSETKSQKLGLCCADDWWTFGTQFLLWSRKTKNPLYIYRHTNANCDACKVCSAAWFGLEKCYSNSLQGN